MKELEFNNLLEDFTREVLGYEVTEYEQRFFWRHFQKMASDLSLDLSAAWDLEDMVHYDALKIKQFRNAMASRGTELTIRQAEIWLVMIEILLIDIGFYEWDKCEN